MSNTKAQLRGTTVDILRKQASENKKIFGILRQLSTGISLAIPQSIPAGSPSFGNVPVSPVEIPGMITVQHTQISEKSFSIIALQKIVLAKWRINWSVLPESGTKKQVAIFLRIYSGQFKTNGSANVSLIFEASDTDTEGGFFALGSIGATSTNFKGAILNNDSLTSPFVVNTNSTAFLRFIITSDMTIADARIREVDLTNYLILPRGLSITKVL